MDDSLIKVVDDLIERLKILKECCAEKDKCKHAWAGSDLDCRILHCIYCGKEHEDNKNVKNPLISENEPGKKKHIYEIIARYLNNLERAEKEHRLSGVYSEYKSSHATNEFIKNITQYFLANFRSMVPENPYGSLDSKAFKYYEECRTEILKKIFEEADHEQC